MTDILEPLPGGTFAPAGTRRPIPVDLRLQAEFPRELGQNRSLGRLTAANRRRLRRSVAEAVEAWFPRAWRESWSARQVPIPCDGHLPDREALQLLSQALSDPRVRGDAVPDKRACTIVYGVLATELSARVRVPLRRRRAPGLPLEWTVELSDPVLPGGTGRLRAQLWAELCWRVPLARDQEEPAAPPEGRGRRPTAPRAPKAGGGD